MFSPPPPMMREYCERDETGTAPVLDREEGEKVIMRNEEVTFAFAPDQKEGLGSLTVTNTRVVWLSSEDESKAFDFDVAYICLHAISKDPETFPEPCIYCQLAVEEEDVLKEAFFAPSDKEGATLQALFEAFSSAAELNPEPGQEAEEPQGAGGLVFDHGSALSAEQERVLAHLDSVLVVPPGMEAQDGQFEDADDGQGDGGNEGANGHAHDGAANGEAANGGGINGALPHAPSS